VAHSRFLAPDRAGRDKWLRDSFGPPEHVRGAGGTRPDRHIVVASQVAEQSLDIDFDLMVTDLAATPGREGGLPPELIEVALPNCVEPLAGSLDQPEGPTVAGYAHRVFHCLGGRGGGVTGGGLDASIRADARVVRLVTAVAYEAIVGTEEAGLQQIFDPDAVASALPGRRRSGSR
jgi:hypothetical protein